MMIWRNWHVYYADLDTLLLNCIDSVVSRHRELSRCFWIRHYAGGTHLRIRAFGDEQQVERFGTTLQSNVQRFLEESPSPSGCHYSAATAAKLLDLESGSLDGRDLSYHIDELIECTYDRAHHGLPSNESLSLLESFHHDAGNLALRVLRSERSVFTEALRLYYLTFIAATGSTERGAVSAKSHWCGFAAFRLPPRIVEAIQHQYAEQQGLIVRHLKGVLDYVASPDSKTDNLLGEWGAILAEYHNRARASLIAGHELCFHVPCQQAERQRSNISEADFLRYPFLRTLWQDLRYLESMRVDVHLALPRVLTNLYYALIGPQLGLRAIDKVALCYFAYRSVEDHFHCTLDDQLRRNIAAANERRAATTSL